MADYYGKWKGGRLVVWGRVDDGKEELWNPNDLAYQPGPVLDAIFGEDAEPEWGPIAEAAAKAAEAVWPGSAGSPERPGRSDG